MEDDDREFYGEDEGVVAGRTIIGGVPAVIDPRRDPVDPKQARIDAVSALLAEAYKNASKTDISAQEIVNLRKPFTDEQVSAGAKGNQQLLYIPHIHLSDRLNDVLGVGQWALVRRSERMDEQSGRVYVDAALLIRGAFVAEAIGAMQYQPGNRMMDYSDAVEGALSDSLSRCCKRLGIGSQVWDKKFCDGWHARQRAGKQPQKPAEAPKPAPPAPPTPPSTASLLPPVSGATVDGFLNDFRSGCEKASDFVQLAQWCRQNVGIARKMAALGDFYTMKVKATLRLIEALDDDFSILVKIPGAVTVEHLAEFYAMDAVARKGGDLKVLFLELRPVLKDEKLDAQWVEYGKALKKEVTALKEA